MTRRENKIIYLWLLFEMSDTLTLVFAITCFHSSITDNTFTRLDYVRDSAAVWKETGATYPSRITGLTPGLLVGPIRVVTHLISFLCFALFICLPVCFYLFVCIVLYLFFYYYFLLFICLRSVSCVLNVTHISVMSIVISIISDECSTLYEHI